MGFLDPGTHDRNGSAELLTNLISEIGVAPAKYGADSTYSPQYTDLAANNLNRFLNGTPGVSVGAQSTLDKALNTQRASDVGAVEKYGGRATAAFRNANPQQASLMNALNKQAGQGLGLGAKLDPSMEREVAQASRAAASSRGLAESPSSGLDEIVMTGERGNQLQQQRRQFAEGVVGLDHSTTIDPFMAILGRPASSAGLAGMTPGGQMFNPESPYGADVFNTNANAKAAASIAGANNRASILGSY